MKRFNSLTDTGLFLRLNMKDAFRELQQIPRNLVTYSRISDFLIEFSDKIDVYKENLILSF